MQIQSRFKILGHNQRRSYSKTVGYIQSRIYFRKILSFKLKGNVIITYTNLNTVANKILILEEKGKQNNTRN